MHGTSAVDMLQEERLEEPEEYGEMEKKTSSRQRPRINNYKSRNTLPLKTNCGEYIAW
jgi:hypothetical protein